MSSNYGKHVNVKNTTQGDKIIGSNQIQNSDGAYVFGVDDWKRLDRFLILGTEGGSFYAKEKALTIENAEAVLRCIDLDGIRVVNKIVEISDKGLAPKNDPAIFALAMAAKMAKNPDVRAAAYDALDKVCRIPTHLFHFVDYAEGFGGWGRGMRRAVGEWYTKKDSETLARHLVKFQGRDGWTNRDLFRLSHPKPESEIQNTLLKWATSGELEDSSALKMKDAADVSGYFHIQAFEQAKTASTARELLVLINKFGLPREAIPTEFLKDATVWEALLEKMPMGAMIRNLGNMSKCGLLTPMSKASATVCERLEDMDRLRKARIHPLGILMALNTYSMGRGIKGSGTWTPVQQVVDSLDSAFYKSFGFVEPTNKRTLLCLDTSGSMTTGTCGGMTGISPRVASAALSLITASVEKRHLFINYSEKASELSISPRMRMTDIIAHINRVAALGTNCAAPMETAIERGYEVDTFILYTDNETNTRGARHPVVALRDYRQRTGIDAKLIVCGMVSNGFSVADPEDAGMLDVVGFNLAVPSVITNFAKE